MENELTIKKEDLVPYIQKQGEEINKMLQKARDEYGHRYNTKNRFEELYRRFQDPRWNPEPFADEFLLIIQKKSQLPAAVRYVVRDICEAAYRQCLSDKLEEYNRRKKREQKEPNTSEEKPN